MDTIAGEGSICDKSTSPDLFRSLSQAKPRHVGFVDGGDHRPVGWECVYEPTAIITLAKNSGYAQDQAVRLASYGTGILSIGTVIGCLTLPIVAERIGRRSTLALYFLA